MQYRKEAKSVRYAFDSLSELQRWIEDNKRTWSISVNDSRDGPKADYWDLKAGYDGALVLARDGWLEGIKDMQDDLERLIAADPAPDCVYDFYGHLPHVARYCAGAPDSMIRHAPRATMGGGRILTLYVPINALSGVSAKAMSNFGIGVARYIDQLERQGIRVELHGVTCSLMYGSAVRKRDTRVTHAWCIKSADQPLDLPVLAFSIGHPAMFRRIVFAAYERLPTPTDDGYGATAPAKLSDLIDPPAGAYILNGMDRADSLARTPESALKFIQEQITKALDNPEAE